MLRHTTFPFSTGSGSSTESRRSSRGQTKRERASLVPHMTTVRNRDQWQVEQGPRFRLSLEGSHELTEVIVIDMDKRLRSTLASYILGETRELNIVGNPILLATLHEVTQASRELLECLRRDSSETEIAESLTRKTEAAKRWKRVTGRNWDL